MSIFFAVIAGIFTVIAGLNYLKLRFDDAKFCVVMGAIYLVLSKLFSL